MRFPEARRLAGARWRTFVYAMLSQAGEALDRQYALKALGYDLRRIAERAAEIFNMDTAEIFFPAAGNRG